MNWTRRPNGELKLAAGEGGKLAVRLEHAETQEQLTGHAPQVTAQLVMNAEAAEALGIELIATANRLRDVASN